MSTISFPQLFATFGWFQEIAKENIEQSIKKMSNQKLQMICLTISIIN